MTVAHVNPDDLRRLQSAVKTSQTEIDQAMRAEIETPIVTQVLLSDLVMPAPPGSEEAVAARGATLAETVTTEAQFADAARRFSATPSAARGGRLEWTPLDNLPPALAQIILAMQPGQISQPLTVPGAVVLLAGVRSVGVQGDGRTYGHPIVLRPVSSEDAMTADWTRVPYDVLERISTRITNEVREVNRVVLDITSKPPGTIEWE